MFVNISTNKWDEDWGVLDKWSHNRKLEDYESIVVDLLVFSCGTKYARFDKNEILVFYHSRSVLECSQ